MSYKPCNHTTFMLYPSPRLDPHAWAIASVGSLSMDIKSGSVKKACSLRSMMTAVTVQAVMQFNSSSSALHTVAVFLVCNS